MSILNFGRKILGYLTLGIFTGLTFGKKKQTYIANLRALRGRADQEYIFSHLYMNLDVLDNKTNSLVQLVAILAATQTAVLGYFLQTKMDVRPVFVLGVLTAYVAAFFCLMVEKVHWSSYDDLANEDTHALRLLDVRNKRTIRYRIAWWLTLSSLIILGYAVDTATMHLVNTAVTLLRAWFDRGTQLL